MSNVAATSRTVISPRGSTNAEMRCITERRLGVVGGPSATDTAYTVKNVCVW